MKYLACFSDDAGLETHLPENELPAWFKTLNFALTVRNGRLALSNSKPSGTYILVREGMIGLRQTPVRVFLL